MRTGQLLQTGSALALSALLACGPSPVGGGGLPDDYDVTEFYDLGSVFESDGIGGPPELVVFVGEDGILTEQGFLLPELLPGPDTSHTVRIQVANFGNADLNVTRLEFLPINADGTSKSSWMSLDWGGADPSSLLPMTLIPHASDKTAVLEVKLLYTPTSPDDKSGTIVIETDVPGATARTVRFDVPALVPRIRTDPTDWVFWDADLFNAETKTIAIHNDGLVPLSVLSVGLDGPSERFVLHKAEALALGETPIGTVGPKGSPGYKPMTFQVSYQPIFGSKLDSIGVVILSDDQQKAQHSVPLKSMFDTTPEMSPCVWDIPFGTSIDFKTVTEGTQTVKMQMTNVGTGVCNLTAITAANDPNGSHWSWKGALQPAPDSGEPALPIDVLPFGVAGGKTIDLSIVYTAGDAGLDSPIQIAFDDPTPRTIDLQGLGGSNKPCFEYVPSGTAGPVPLPFVGPHGAKLARTFFIRSCGSGTLTVHQIKITDDILPGQASPFFSITSPGVEQIKVAPGGIQQFDLSATLPDEGVGTGVKASMDVVWIGGEGPETITVPLSIAVDAETVLPTANPGPPENYAGAVAGEPLTLDASASTSNQPESSGEPWDGLDENGALWFVIKRPEGSEATLPEAFGPPQVAFTPDVAGTYQLGLLVLTPKPGALMSPLQLANITVKAPPDPDPDPDPDPEPDPGDGT